MKPIETIAKMAKSRVFVGMFCFAVGLLAGTGVTLFFQNYNPPDESETLSPTVVFDRIVSQNELVTVSQDYCITDKAVDCNRLFDLVDIPLTQNSYWYRYEGTVKAAVNLEDADFVESGNQLTVTLSAPYVSSNDPDWDESGVLEESNNILNPIHVEDVDAFQKQCDERSTEEAIEGGLLEDAKSSAEKNIRDMFGAALGDQYQVNVIWRE